jgi:hypothetical protein
MQVYLVLTFKAIILLINFETKLITNMEVARNVPTQKNGFFVRIGKLIIKQKVDFFQSCRKHCVVEVSGI